MTPSRIAGMILVALGLVALLWGGFFWKDRHKVVDAGPLQITTERDKGVAIPPLAGAISIVAGIVLIALPGRRGTR